jgi:hypothetical protein
MKGKSPLKVIDVLVIVLSAALAFAAGSYTQGKAFSKVTVCGPDKIWVFPLEAEELLAVYGSIGETVVEIREGKAAIISSPCSGQTCVAAGKMHRNGQWAACLPNRVFLLVEGVGDNEVIDGISW